MRLLRRRSWFLVLITSGCCLATCQGCSRRHKVSREFPVSEYVDVVIGSVKARKAPTGAVGRQLEMAVSITNKVAEEIEVFFNGRQYQCAGGFYVHVGPRVYTPMPRLAGLKEYNSLPTGYGLLPAGGRKDFELLLDLPEADARRVLAREEDVRVILTVHGIRRKGIYTEILGTCCDVPARWDSER